MKRHSSSRNRSRLIILGGVAVFVVAIIVLIQNVGQSNSDVAGVAINASEENISNEQKNCEEIQETEQKNSCYMQLAKKVGNDALCKFVSQDMQGKCYFDVASITRNTGSCMNIRDEIGKSLCLQQVATDGGNPQICLKAGIADIRTTCVSNIAKKREDVGLCGLLVNQSDRTLCEEKVKGTAGEP